MPSGGTSGCDCRTSLADLDHWPSLYWPSEVDMAELALCLCCLAQLTEWPCAPLRLHTHMLTCDVCLCRSCRRGLTILVPAVTWTLSLVGRSSLLHTCRVSFFCLWESGFLGHGFVRLLHLPSALTGNIMSRCTPVVCRSIGSSASNCCITSPPS